MIRQIDYLLTKLEKRILWTILLISGFSIFALFNLAVSWGEQQFVYLAQSVLQGKLYFTQIPGSYSDLIFYNGHYFWPSAPFPIVLFLPLVSIFGIHAYQGLIMFILNLINFILLFKISKVITKSTESSFWLSFSYLFSTAYIFQASIPWSWFISQILVTTLVLLAIYLFLQKKDWLLIGTVLSLAILTRSNLIFGLLFFLYFLIKDTPKQKLLLNLIKLFLPITLACLALALYNYYRFDNLFERGDSLANLQVAEVIANRSYGLWSLVHIPTNLYYLFFKGFDGIFIPNTKVLTFPYIKFDPWGASIFLTSPILMMSFKANWKNIYVRLAMMTILLILFFDSGWFSAGAYQYGYRYAMDFMPFLFIILCFAVQQKISTLAKSIILGSFALNLYLLLTIIS